MGQQETLALQQTASLFDDLVGDSEQRRRHGQTERLGGLQVDHKLVLGRLFDRMSPGFAPRKILSTSSAARRKFAATLGP
jgi:hypothetical protein